MANPILKILRSCGRGNRKSQMALYDILCGRFFASAMRITGCREDAEEAVHDAFMKIFDCIDGGSMPDAESDSSAMAWMNRVVVNSSLDYLRRRELVAGELTENLSDEVYDPSQEDDGELPDGLSVEAVHDACSRLKDGYRTILSLYLFEGYDHEEIACILDMRPATVRVQYSRARRALIKILDKNG